MNYYLVDFENVKKDGLDGVHLLNPEDKVCIFYSKNADSITFDQHRRIMESKADIELCKVEVGSKNALDFQPSPVSREASVHGPSQHAPRAPDDAGPTL